MVANSTTGTGDTPNREELLNMAIRAAKNGQAQGARVMLRKVLTEDKRNERALLWMAKLAKTPKERRQWLDRVLIVNPDNAAAQSEIDKMDYETMADRNKTLLRVGIGVWVAFVLIGSILMFIIIT